MNRGSCFFSAPPLADRTMPVRRCATRMPASAAGWVAASHATHTSARKSWPGALCSVELLVAAVAVEADRRSRQQHRRLAVEAGQRAGQEVGVRTRLSMISLLVGVGPAVVADAGAGQVHDGVDAVERRCVDGARLGIPADGVGLGRGAADQAQGMVARSLQRRPEGRCRSGRSIR